MKVEFRWADRHFILPQHIATKIANGATRNLRLRNVQGRLTEETIRDDMEHIHNLVIIDVTFTGGDIIVSTNSVHNAMYARTCMMSRGSYKGIQIESYEDECSTPFPSVHIPVPRKENALPTRKAVSSANRFGLLNMDNTEDVSDDESTDDGKGQRWKVDPYSKNGTGVSWAETSIAAAS